MKRCLPAGLALGVALAALPAAAQTGTARGKVFDEQGQPLEAAKIELDFQGGVTRHYETKSNKKGEFTQVGLQPGVYKITATKDGYQGSFIETRISLGDPTYLPDFKLANAAAAAKAAAEKKADDIQGPFSRAAELIRAAKYEDAEILLREILSKNADIPEVHNNLGYAHAQQKEWAAAEEAYQKALALRPGYADAVNGLAEVYEKTGRADKAAELMTQAGENPKVLFRLAINHINANERDKAEVLLRRVEVLDPENSEAQYHLASIALNQGKTDEAIARLEKYLSMSPADPNNAANARQLLDYFKNKK